jgi:hypothetical protein
MRHLSAAMVILDEKRRPVPAKFGPHTRTAFRGRARASGARKEQSINHAGKEMNTLRRSAAA